MAPAAPRLPRGVGASGAWTKIGCGLGAAAAGVSATGSLALTLRVAPASVSSAR
ncbi:MAG: hypothetical protein K0S70_3987 [Microbacterium sp.]|nr:hypothetical protein [Microbacterium sp.]